MQKLAEICVRRPVFATVIILVLTVIGGFSFFTLGVDRFPKIDIPTVSVTATNTGRAPAEMETEVTDVLEGAVNTATGIDELRSSSSTGRSSISISFDLSKDPDVATQEVRDKVNTVLNRLRAYNLSTTDVANALRAQNLELPGGRVNEGAQTLTLRTMSRVTKVEEFNQIAVANRNGYSVKIGDLGKVEDGGVDPNSISSL